MGGFGLASAMQRKLAPGLGSCSESRARYPKKKPSTQRAGRWSMTASEASSSRQAFCCRVPIRPLQSGRPFALRAQNGALAVGRGGGAAFGGGNGPTQIDRGAAAGVVAAAGVGDRLDVSQPAVVVHAGLGQQEEEGKGPVWFVGSKHRSIDRPVRLPATPRPQSFQAPGRAPQSAMQSNNAPRSSYTHHSTHTPPHKGSGRPVQAPARQHHRCAGSWPSSGPPSRRRTFARSSSRTPASKWSERSLSPCRRWLPYVLWVD